MDFLISFCIIVLVATVFTYIFNRLKQPSILAFIITGIIVGPLVFGWVSNTTEIKLLSEIGIAFLLFSVGISTDINHLKKLNLSVFILPILNVIFTFVFFILFKDLLAINYIQALYLSFIVSFSSTILVAKLILDNFEMGALYAKLSIGILLVEDLIAILAIPILKNIDSISYLFVLQIIGEIIVLAFFAFILKKFVYPYIIKTTYSSSQGFFLLTIGSCFLFVFISQLMKFDIAVGAFIGGLSIAIYPYNFEMSHRISSVRNLLSMIFFVSLGLQLSFNFTGGYLLLIFLFIGVYVLKPLIHFIILMFSGYGARVSSKSTIYLTQVSEFSLILAMQAFALSQITSAQYSAIIIITSVSMLSTPYLARYTNELYLFLTPAFDIFKHKFFKRKVEYISEFKEKLKDHIVLVGCDTIGEGITKVLKDNNIPLIVVDISQDKIEHLLKKNINAICGDINNEEILHQINIEGAKLIVSTLPRFDTTMQFIKTIKKINSKVPIFTVANRKEQVIELYNEGADLVITPKVLESNLLLEKIGEYMFSKKDVLNYKFEYLAYLKREEEIDKRSNLNLKK